MSARRALLLAPISVSCRACSSSSSSSSSNALTGSKVGSSAYRRFSSQRKFLSNEGANPKRLATSTSRSPRATNSSVSDLPVPKSIAAHLDEYVIGQDQAKRALAVGVFNHYLRASSNSNVVEEEEYTKPVLFAEKRKSKKMSSTKENEEEEILSDYIGQTKGSKRWNDQIEDGERGSELPFSDRSGLSSDFFSSLRPEDRYELPPKTDRLMQSTSKTIMKNTLMQMPRKTKTQPETQQMDKSNMILIGPSGSGKTHLIRTLSTFLSVPFVHVDATPLTSAGYVGEDVESIMSRLLEATDWNVADAERGIVCIDEVDKLASPNSSSSSGITKTAGRDVGGTGVQQALLRLLEGGIVNVADKRPSAPMTSKYIRARASTESKPWWSPEMQTLNAEHGRAAQAMRAGGSGTSEMLSDARKRASLVPGSDGTDTLKIDTSKILFILCGAFVGLQDILAARGSTRLEDVEAEDLTGFGLIPEFVGRLPVIVTLNNLTEKDLCRILTEPRNALVTQYQRLFALSGIKLHFTTPAINSLAHQAAQSSKTSSGARVLKRLMEKRLLDAMFDGPNGGASYALMDEMAAQGKSQVHLYSRGGKAAWLNAIEEDEERYKKSQNKTKKPAKIEPFSPTKVNPSQVHLKTSLRQGSSSSKSILDRTDEANLRRRARARLTRPSRVGNLRILTSDG